MSFIAYGTSPYVTITSEEMEVNRFNSETSVNLTVNPPHIEVGNSVSYAMLRYDNPWNPWTFDKIAEPKYDGIADDIGQISNKPDLIKDHHFIGVMRLVTQYIKPAYQATINSYSNGVSPIGPPAKSQGE